MDQPVEYRWGLPVVNAKSVFAVLGALGLKPWPLLEALPADEYRRRELSPAELRELRFLPEIEAAVFKNPAGDSQTYFRIRSHTRYADVFALLPDDLVPVTASFRQGAELICFTFPGGRVDEGESVLEAAKREFIEETGIALEGVRPLDEAGIPVHPGFMDERVFPFLGLPRLPIVPVRPRLDAHEFTYVVLMPITEWLKFLHREEVNAPTLAMTFLALQKLNRLEFLPTSS